MCRDLLRFQYRILHYHIVFSGSGNDHFMDGQITPSGYPTGKTGNDFGVEIPEEINTDLRDIVLTEEMLAKGNRLMDMNLPKGMLVMLIKRGNEFMIPNGSLQLHAGDKLLIISESKTK